MIHDAIDTVIALGVALLAWIAVFAVVGAVVLFTGVAVGAWAWRTARKRVSGPLWARGRLRDRILARARHGRPQSRSDDPDYEEAA